MEGEIQFSYVNFTDILESSFYVSNTDTIYHVTYKMEKTYETVSVPAGIFQVWEYVGTIVVNPSLINVQNPRYSGSSFAPNVGRVLRKWVFVETDEFVMEDRLIRYNVYLPE